jgi:acyl transferase domain-containing protein
MFCCSPADGYGRAEACVVLHLSADNGGSSIAGGAILCGTFVNQDGRSSSLTAPNGPAQQAVIRGALAAAELQPQYTTGLEMHGTGTALGDPIEVGAATEVLPGPITARTAGGPLHLSAAKSRFGHAEPAAGSIGMAQAIGQLTDHCSNAIMSLTSGIHRLYARACMWFRTVWHHNAN